MKKTTLRQAALRLLFVALMCIPWVTQSQTTITIGEGTSTQNYPLPGYYGWNYDVFLYTPDAHAALGADFDISSIAFYVATNSTTAGAEISIWVKDVDPGYALASTTTFNDYITDATLVYEDNDFSSTSGWNTLDFSSTFSHEAGKYILVAVRGVGCNANGGCSRSCRYTSASGTYWYKRADNNDPGQNVSGTISSYRANIQLDITYTGAVCLTPSGLNATNVTHETATLSWAENGSATGWILQYGTDDTFASFDDELDVQTDPTVDIDNLTPLTTYYVRVKPDCDNDDSHWSNVYSFSTSAVAEAVGDLWSDDFEGSSCEWELVNGTLTNQWAWGTAINNGGTNALYVSNDNGTSNAYSNNSYTMIYATKLLSFTQSKYNFSYDWKANGESTYDYIRVALVPPSVTLTAGTSVPSGFSATALPSGWIALDGGSKLNLATAWQTKSVDINVPSGNYYLVFAWRNDNSGGTNPPAAIDNVSIERFLCPYEVNGLQVDIASVTTTDATINWDAGEATAWQVATNDGGVDWTILPTIYTTASASLTGLNPSTNYQVKVRAYCNANDQGSWCEPISFATDCDVISAMGFSQNFDNITVASAYTPTSRTLPNCWSAINECTNNTYKYYPTIYNSTSYSNSTPNSLRFYSYYSSYTNYDPQPQYAILPEMDDLAGKQITLQARGYNANSTFKVGTMSDPTDASTFTEVTNPDNPSAMTTSYQEYKFNFPPTTTDSYVAIMIEAANSTRTTNGVYIDDIVFGLAPTCFKPTEAHADVQDANNATISWTPDTRNTAGGSYSILDENHDVVTGAENITGTSFLLDGLNPETPYTFYVHTNCFNSAENVDDVSVTFTTPADCAAPVLAADAFTNISAHQATVSWTGFASNDEYVVSYRTAAYINGITEDFNGTSFPSEWTKRTGVLNTDGTATLTGTSSWSHGTSNNVFDKHIYMNMYSTKNYWLITPSITINDGDALSFDIAYTAYTTGNALATGCLTHRFAVLISTDNMATWTILREWNNSGSSYVLDDVSQTGETVDDIDISAYDGQTVYIAFFGHSETSSYDNNFHLDNVTIGEAIPATAWQTVTPNPTTTTAQITGLTAEKKYDVKVNGVCGGSEETTGSAIQSFTTTIACPAPTTLAAALNATDATSMVDLTWVMTGAETDWQLCINSDETNLIDINESDVTTNNNTVSYTLTGLTPGTDYTFKVRANCEASVTGDGTSEWSNTTATIQTDATCVEPTAFALVDNSVEAHQAQLSWTAGGVETAWDIYYSTINTAPVNGVTPPTLEGITANPYTLGTLNAATTYYVWVRAHCGDADGQQSPWIGPVSFLTECEAISTFPVYYGFETTEGFPSNASTPTTNQLGPCWRNEATVKTGTNSTRVWGTSTSYKHDGSQSLILPDKGNATNYAKTMLVFPAMDFTSPNGYIVTFWIYRSGSSSNPEGFKVYASDTDTIGNNAIELGHYSRNYNIAYPQIESATGWYYYETDPIMMTGTTYIIFEGQSYYGSATYVDDVTIEVAPTCRKPKSLLCSDKTAHTATLSWTDGEAGQTDWQIAYSTNADFDPNSVTPVDVQSNPATIQGLEQFTDYYAYVRANCGFGDYSAWSVAKVSFKTLKGNLTPTGLAVEDANITSTTAIATWNAVASNDYHQSYDIYWAPSTVTEVPATPAAPNFIEGISATSQLIDGLEAEHDYNVWVRDNCGTDGYSSWSSLVTFTTAAACQTPTFPNDAVSNLTAHNATITWNTFAQTGFNLRYKKDTETNWNTITGLTTWPFTFSAYNCSLDENTTYEVQIQAACTTDPDDPNSWSAMLTFTTLCDAQTITAASPFYEGFENWTTGTYVYSATDGVYPDCWNSYSEGSVYPHIINSGSYFYIHEGYASMYFKGESNTSSYLALPYFTNNLNTLVVSFWMQTENASNGKLSIGYITDADVNYNTYQPIKTYDNHTGSMVECITLLGGYQIPSNATRLVFRWIHTATSWYGACIDDVKVAIADEIDYPEPIVAGKWYAISSPINNPDVADVTNLTTGAAYDLYQYNENAGTWTEPTNLATGRGYIYRRAADATITFKGIKNTTAVTASLTYTSNTTTDPDLAGFNLIGNPFTTYYNIGDCYTLEPNGSWEAHVSSTIPAMTGFLMRVTSTTDINFNPNAKSSSAPVATPAIAFTVNGKDSRDVAYARFNDGEGLPKIGHLDPTAPVLCIPVEGRRYAIANLGSDCESFDMNFSGNGEFTLSVNAEALTLGYLHLYDKVTGTDVDLLRQHSYTFSASNGDLSARFLVKLRPDAMDAANGAIATWNGRNWVINANGDLQLFDALGRNILAQKNTAAGYQIPSTIFPTSGVYIIRLGEKTQKIVVK